MQLVNMEVERTGTDARCYLGPFSPGLNAICGPRGSGKTTLLGWLRQIAAERYGLDYAQIGRGNPLPMSGSLEIRDRGRTFRAINYSDGHTDFGQTTENRLDRYSPADNGNGSQNWLSPTQREAFSGLLAAHGTADTEGELNGLARRLGIEVVEGYAGHDNLAQLETRRGEIVNQLRTLETLSLSRDELVSRRDELESELQRIRQHGSVDVQWDSVHHDRLDSRWIATKEDLESTTQQIAAIDGQIAQRQADLKLFETNNAVVEVSASYREQLQEIDDRLNRWRRTLRDLRSHRQGIEYTATDARLDEQVGDQLSPTKQPDPRGALRALEASLLNSRKQLDELTGRSGTDLHTLASEYEVIRQADGETRLVATDTHSRETESSALPDILRSMQKDLYDVCQQLARHQSQSTAEKLSNQSGQLQRAESELLASIEKLIEERASLLRRIADEHDLSLEKLTLAFGQWSQCQDHPNLNQWLAQEELTRQPKLGAATMEDRQRLLEEIESLRKQRQTLELHSDHCRRQLSDSDAYRRGLLTVSNDGGTPTAERDLTGELHRVIDDLNRLTERERLATELRDIESRLAIPVRDSRQTGFAAAVNSHIKAIMGAFTPKQADRRYRSHAPRHYDPVDGLVSDTTIEYETYEKSVPSVIVRIAQRLAIAESLAARGEAISLVLDESLDELSTAAQQRVLAHLAVVADRGQQIVVLTADQRIAQDVQSHRGWVGYMQQAAAAAPRSYDVNRQLSAFANEEEADKWYRSRQARESNRDVTPRSEYYLRDSSLIEELPSLDAPLAARCRALRVDSIGDLLDTDPAWLADQLELGDGEVERLQAEAQLLCSVRDLRPFDARVLVGAGIRSASQLAGVQPGKLIARVEDFLETERGRRILNSGSRYELSRIQTWISAARTGDSRYQRSSRDGEYGRREYDERSRSGASRSSSRSNGRGESYTNGSRSSSRSSSSRSSSSDRNGSSRSNGSDRNGSSRSNGSDRNGSSRSSSSRSSSSRSGSNHSGERSSRRSSDRERNGDREYSRNRDGERRSSRRSDRDSSDNGYSVVSRNGSSSRSEAQVRIAETSSSESAVRLKFYLELSDPVVDAPTIGPRMATRLEKHAIITVADLLSADCVDLAEKLDNRRVTPEIVRAWQLQAELVCRIPNLRGHDAQMLVACEVNSPESLVDMDASTVLHKVLEFAQTSDGQRVLRGGKQPDLEEVNDWITWSGSSRSLSAA